MEDVAPFFIDLVGKESGYRPNAKQGSYTGYYQMKIPVGTNPQTQNRLAVKHLNDIIQHKLTDVDLERADKMGIADNKLLTKLWNQGSHVMNYLHNGIDHEDGLGTTISQYGNDFKDRDMNLDEYVPKANRGIFHIVRKGDTIDKISEKVRNDDINYADRNGSIVDINKNIKERFNPNRLRLKDTVWLMNPQREEINLRNLDKGTLDELNRVSKSEANFIKRAEDKNRDVIKGFDLFGLLPKRFYTHLLGYTDVDGKTIIYPRVQEINGKLKKFWFDRNAIESAIEHGDTIQTTPEFAEFFTKNYKKIYPF